MEEKQEHQGLKKKEKKKIQWILGIIIFLFLTIIVLHQLGYIRFPWEQQSLIGSNVKEGALPGMSEEELQEYLQRQADESNVSLKMNGQPVFENGSSEGTLLIENPHFNKYDMVARIYLGNDNTGRQIYESGRIPPGHHVDKDRLTSVLDKGIYEAIAYVTFYDGEIQLNTASINLRVVINN